MGRTQKYLGELTHRLGRLRAKRHGAANARYSLLKLNVGHSDLLSVVDEKQVVGFAYADYAPFAESTNYRLQATSTERMNLS
jgi:hypothetical protein